MGILKPASVICDATDTSQHVVQRVSDGLELHDATPLALDVLAQCTESAEPHPASAERAFIDLALVTGARQVAIKIAQRLELGVTKHTLVCSAVPRADSRDVIHGVITTSKKTRRIGNDIVAVHITYVSVNLLTVNPRLTTTGLEVKYQCRLGHKSPVTSTERTWHVFRLVKAGIQMRSKITLGPEETFARNAIAVLVTLPVVLVKSVFILEHPVTRLAVVMIIAIVINKSRAVGKVVITVLAVIMVRILHPVFFETPPGREVYAAVIADIVVRGVTNMLTVGKVRGEVTFATIAVAAHHWLTRSLGCTRPRDNDPVVSLLYSHPTSRECVQPIQTLIMG